MEIHQNFFLGINGVVYARRQAYRDLTHTSIDKYPTDESGVYGGYSLNLNDGDYNDYPNDQYYPVYQSNNSTVPRLKELLWVPSHDYYLGITIDGHLYSFMTNELIEFEYPIQYGYTTSNVNTPVLLMLESGNIRLVRIGTDDRGIISINDVHIDRVLSDNVYMIRPVTLDSLTYNGSTESSKFIIVTTDDQFIIIEVYQDEEYGPVIAIDEVISRGRDLQHSGVIDIVGNLILVAGGIIYDINRPSSNEMNTLSYSLLDRDDIIDIHIINVLDEYNTRREVALLTNDNQVLFRGEAHENIAGFVDYYTIDDANTFYDNNHLVLRTIDGQVYKVDGEDDIPILPPNNALNIESITAKPVQRYNA